MSYLGELVSALAHTEQGIALYDPLRHRSHALLYGQDPGTTIANVRLIDVTLRSCANGLTLQQSETRAARVDNLLVVRLTCEDIYGGPALSIKQGDSAVFRDIRLSCRPGNVDSSALQMGVWLQPVFERCRVAVAMEGAAGVEILP